ncbi:DUF6701 domain-containing protein [Vibrio sp. SCSIO 43137]|uniref:DUF6701 domain-containing protein n=1 Tax=Vibrio sp. SCSIO 43137 TaxID=3021011 RepID=UPI002308078D|nr:DUF6701 domain-containing protein [Vibrio sp. SCSIO 43137]WCE30012.1 hypothetical protein PK654_01535 [Vibrio sp. SCSIO 43137]
MRFLVAILLIVVSFQGWSATSTCTGFHGNKNFHLQFDITSAQQSQQIIVDQTGNSPDVIVYSTVAASGALFVDSALYSATPVNYQVLITSDGGSEVNYYRRLAGTTGWPAAISTAFYNFKNGILRADSNDGSIDLTSCSDYIPDLTPPVSYQLEVTPVNDFALQCENPQFTFTVKDSNTGNVVTDYSGTISVTLPSGVTVQSVVQGGISGSNYTTNNGVLILALSSSQLGQFTVSGELDSGETDSSQLYVAPYKFGVNTVNAIAARETVFTLNALACNNGSATVVSGYQGSKNLLISDKTLQDPTLAEGASWGVLTVSNQSGTSANPNLSLDFSSGSASGSINYTESGSISFKITDPAFTCPSGFDCKAEDDEAWNGLQAIVNINSRPWTFAICDPDDAVMDGTSSSGTKYKSAGSLFNLNVKPIVYQSGGALSGEVDVASYCSASVTNNFYVTNGPLATVYLKGALATPSSGRIGSGSNFLSSGGDSKRHYEKVSGENYYSFSDLRWDEVGSLKVTADIGSANYLGMTINTGYRNVGRFYPANLSILNSTDLFIQNQKTIWQYPSGYNNFAYMGQPIIHNFIVQANSATGTATQNYGLFSDDQIETLDYMAIAQTGSGTVWSDIDSSGAEQRIKSGDTYRWDGSHWGKTLGIESAQLSVAIAGFEFEKKQDSSAANYTSEADGPYSDTTTKKSLFGLKVLDKTTAEVDFSTLDFGSELAAHTTHQGKKFDSQPLFRYGRMTLQDVGGNQDIALSVPLKTEYWDGSNFVTNSYDDGSDFNPAYYCREQIWRDGSGSSDASFSSSGTEVVDGQSDTLSAQHTESREQVRLWLRQQASLPSGVEASRCFSSGTVINQPWLRYNWRGLGDEDPSAVITFGVYRGNDRVIFRGEPRLSGD